ncbi:MAG TPA: universal stress protein [Cyclobacteriaceae bacterium]
MTEIKLPIKKALITLDLTYMDQLLIRYIKSFAEAVPELEHLVFYHNIRFDYPEQANEIIRQLGKPLEEVLAERITENVKDNIGDLSFEVKVDQSQDTADAIYEIQKLQQFDLIATGQKVTYTGSGYLIERIMHHKPKANILVIPETAYHRFEKILVPIDFSRKSGQTLLKAIELRKKINAEVSCQHVYAVPNIYFPYIPVKDLKVKMEKQSAQDWKRFKEKHLKDADYKPDITFSFHAERSIAQMIYENALKNQIDMIVVPSEAGLVHGTVVQLLNIDMHIPLFVVYR